MRQRLKFVTLLCSLLFIANCENKPAVESGQGTPHGLVEKYIKAITFNNEKDFLECFLHDEKDQETAAIGFKIFQLQRTFHSLIISKYGKEGWETYQAHEDGGMSITNIKAELKVEEIDSYLERIHITENDERATIIFPDLKWPEDKRSAIRIKDLWYFENELSDERVIKLFIAINTAYEHVIKLIDNNEITVRDIAKRFESFYEDALEQYDPNSIESGG